MRKGVMIQTPVLRAKPARATTMKAAVLQASQHVELESVRIPEPGPTQVRVRIEGCGVCASNLPVWQGRPWFDYPLQPGAPGHEGWGTIEAVGRDVQSLHPGDRVAMLSTQAYAEYDLTEASAVVPLPLQLAGKPFPGEALGCAMNIFKRSRATAGETVAIVGVGFLGALLTRLAFRAGARVIAITRRPFALEIARRFGAEHTIAADDQRQIIAQVKALTNGLGCECVIEAVGLQGPLDLAAELVRESGRLVIAGYHQDGLRRVNMQLWNWRGLDVINAHERNPEINLEAMRRAVDAVLRGDIDPAPLYTHTYGLNQLGEALAAMHNRPDGFIKALITT
jgi:threonine dehydrogenase-like Zn-dependent dehydrogenase